MVFHFSVTFTAMFFVTFSLNIETLGVNAHLRSSTNLLIALTSAVIREAVTKTYSLAIPREAAPISY